MNIFHLAIPSKNLDESRDFYTKYFDATVGREYPNGYVLLNFHGHQLACRFDPDKIDKEVTMYPRHFGIIFENKNDFDHIYQNCIEHNAPFFKERFSRYENKPGWHETFFIQDPSNNLIEVKYYYDKNDIY